MSWILSWLESVIELHKVQPDSLLFQDKYNSSLVGGNAFMPDIPKLKYCNTFRIIHHSSFIATLLNRLWQMLFDGSDS